MGQNHGSYVVDDSGGPSPWVLVGGGVAIIAVALAIGWAPGQGQHKTDTVVRQPLNPTPIRTAGFASTVPSYGWGTPVTAAPSVNYHPTVRWVYTPPASARPVLPPPPMDLGPRPEDMPPPNMGVMLAMSAPPRQAPVVTAVLPVEPVAPPVAVMAYAPAVFGMPGTNRDLVDTTPGPLTSVQAPSPDIIPASAGREDPHSDWIYDPVQERWALRAERAEVRQSPYRLVRPRGTLQRSQ